MNLATRYSALALAATALALAACQREAAPAPAASTPAAPAATPPAATPTAADDAPETLQRTVAALMKQQYGDGFDAKQNCWAFDAQFDGGSGNRYCMRAGAAKVVELQGQRRLYLAAGNVGDAEGYSYGHAEPGLMGAFVLGPDGRGGWSLLSGDKQLAFGSSGQCGCEDAQLVRIGAATMAWKFASGGVWQGTVVSYYSLVAAVDGKIVDLSSIPQITEDDQDSEYALSIDDSDTSRPFFPLRVTKTTQQAGGKSVQSEQTVEFDPGKRSYALAEPQ